MDTSFDASLQQNSFEHKENQQPKINTTHIQNYELLGISDDSSFSYGESAYLTDKLLEKVESTAAKCEQARTPVPGWDFQVGAPTPETEGCFSSRPLYNPRPLSSREVSARQIITRLAPRGLGQFLDETSDGIETQILKPDTPEFSSIEKEVKELEYELLGPAHEANTQFNGSKGLQLLGPSLESKIQFTEIFSQGQELPAIKEESGDLSVSTESACIVQEAKEHASSFGIRNSKSLEISFDASGEKTSTCKGLAIIGEESDEVTPKDHSFETNASSSFVENDSCYKEPYSEITADSFAEISSNSPSALQDEKEISVDRDDTRSMEQATNSAILIAVNTRAEENLFDAQMTHTDVTKEAQSQNDQPADAMLENCNMHCSQDSAQFVHDLSQRRKSGSSNSIELLPRMLKELNSPEIRCRQSQCQKSSCNHTGLRSAIILPDNQTFHQNFRYSDHCLEKDSLLLSPSPWMSMPLGEELHVRSTIETVESHYEEQLGLMRRKLARKERCICHFREVERKLKQNVCELYKSLETCHSITVLVKRYMDNEFSSTSSVRSVLKEFVDEGRVLKPGDQVPFQMSLARLIVKFEERSKLGFVRKNIQNIATNTSKENTESLVVQCEESKQFRAVKCASNDASTNTSVEIVAVLPTEEVENTRRAALSAEFADIKQAAQEKEATALQLLKEKDIRIKALLEENASLQGENARMQERLESRDKEFCGLWDELAAAKVENHRLREERKKLRILVKKPANT